MGRLAPFAAKGGCCALALLFATAARAGEPVTRTLVVPPALAAVTSNPEPSGVVWSPSLGRYLVVSDDTGLASRGTRHAPWLLGLATDGAFDAKPIPIHGVERINDPESICAGPDGTYFLVTSHSPNRRDEVGRARRQLLQLKEDQGALTVVARADLTRTAGSRSLLQIAGLPPDGRLDIEAVGYRHDALFVGLKSPLGERGEALILRIAHPEQAWREGKLRESDITRFVAVPLCVAAPKRQVCQGISDLVFLADGSLVVAANAPKGGPKDGGGALWHLAVPVGKAPPRLIHRFQGRKPEGVTLSSVGRSLVVVFDRGELPPEWVELPLPDARAQ